MQVEVPVPGNFPIEAALSQFKHLQGKVLTIIEASSEDRNKVKAMKDLVNSAFRDQMAWIETQGHDQICMRHTATATTFGPVNSKPEESAA